MKENILLYAPTVFPPVFSHLQKYPLPRKPKTELATDCLWRNIPFLCQECNFCHPSGMYHSQYCCVTMVIRECGNFPICFIMLYHCSLITCEVKYTNVTVSEIYELLNLTCFIYSRCETNFNVFSTSIKFNLLYENKAFWLEKFDRKQ